MNALLCIVPFPPKNDGRRRREFDRYPASHVPGYQIFGSLMPPCPFCGEKSVLVVFSISVDRFASKVERGLLLHYGDVLLECTGVGCVASTTIIDQIGEGDLGEVVAVAKEQSRRVVKRRKS